jgi:hypothetical protein
MFDPSRELAMSRKILEASVLNAKKKLQAMPRAEVLRRLQDLCQGLCAGTGTPSDLKEAISLVETHFPNFGLADCASPEILFRAQSSDQLQRYTCLVCGGSMLEPVWDLRLRVCASCGPRD